MTTHLFKGLIPLFMAGVILSGILAATMSTSDSQLLIASSCVSKNLFQGLFKKEMSEEKGTVSFKDHNDRDRIDRYLYRNG